MNLKKCSKMDHQFLKILEMFCRKKKYNCGKVMRFLENIYPYLFENIILLSRHGPLYFHQWVFLGQLQTLPLRLLGPLLDWLILQQLKLKKIVITILIQHNWEINLLWIIFSKIDPFSEVTRITLSIDHLWTNLQTIRLSPVFRKGSETH